MPGPPPDASLSGSRSLENDITTRMLPRSPRVLAPALILGALALGLSAPRARSQSADAVLRAAAERYAGVSSLCAGFRQRVEVRLLNEVRESRGRLCQKDPDLFSMHFADPEGDVVVADGEHFWIYYPSINPGQVIRAPMARGTGRFDFHREFLDEPAAKYEARFLGTEEVDGHEVHHVGLVPKGEEPYREAEVWIGTDDRLIRRVRVVEENGTVRTVTLEDIELDADPAAEAFTFTPPPGTRVITAPTRTG